MKKDPKIFLLHILESIANVEDYLAGKTKKDFLESELLQDAFIRRLEVIGEAVSQIPDDVRRAFPKVSWQEISGMRNKLIYEYFIVDLHLVWEVVRKDIPQLKKQITKVLEEIG
ncbi:MAG: hypothetical protein A3G00_03360 [Candidatus Magasanikbacteria bacterium RIFCSPLOWO2_12_FULL_43_12]|uniref:DUF86 domain-containing protein n=1 Tax=Candidatus Magasanikbacteria bacterium RIFCSPLOWO2_12_FULL_43_12 TaxID=1798692 RepID=A0A1F6MVS6_9BACT|nr:MAG: hypothetical protein A3G00_03360 [Candidatus Magasanikbacteria bacterium RIFCSPLOWO2_12_FULL_43_12]